jgi:hypothetical protein
MNGNLSGFDAKQVEPNSFDVLPAGEYDAVIVSSTVEATSKGDGKFLKLELQVLNGEFQNRKTWDRLNLWNPSAKAVEIAKGTLSAICRAVGVLTPQDSSDLHGKPLRIKVVVKKSDEYGEQNEVKAYKPRLVAPASSPMLTQDPSPAYQAMRDASPF